MSQTTPFVEGIAKVNTAPAQTWNYLKINETTFTLPYVKHKGAVVSRLPQIFSTVSVPLGAQATEWIEQSAKDALFVDVKQKRNEPILCTSNSDEDEVSDSGVIVREGMEATIIALSYGTQDKDENATSANLLRVIAEKHSKVKIVEVLALPNKCQHLHGVGVDAADDAEVEVYQYVLSGERNALGFGTSLSGQNSKLELSLRYIARNKDLLDITHSVKQKGVSSRSKLTTSGLLLDSAEKTLRETIDLIHGAKGAEGNESETVLIAGDSVINKTLPVILCDEDDVQGNHGASIGSISQEQIEYLSSRGIPEDLVPHMFERSIFDDALIHADDPLAISAILHTAENVFSHEEMQDIADTLGIEH